MLRTNINQETQFQALNLLQLENNPDFIFKLAYMKGLKIVLKSLETDLSNFNGYFKSN